MFPNSEYNDTSVQDDFVRDASNVDENDPTTDDDASADDDQRRR